MRLRPNTWRRLRWTCTVLTVVLLVPWTASFWFFAQRNSHSMGGPYISFSFRCGTLMYMTFTRFEHGGAPDHDTMEWRLDIRKPHWPQLIVQYHVHPIADQLYDKDVILPLTPLLAAMLAATGWLWWREVRTRRRKAWQCAKCGYDRRGLAATSAKCPECGAADVTHALQRD